MASASISRLSKARRPEPFSTSARTMLRLPATHEGKGSTYSATREASRCTRVTGVDSSRPALEVADQNAALNGLEIEWIEANAFDLLKDYSASNRRYDTIVLDPPAFAKTRRDLDSALRGN